MAVENVVVLVDYGWDEERGVWRWYAPPTDRFGEVAGTKEQVIKILQNEVELIKRVYKHKKARRKIKAKSA